MKMKFIVVLACSISFGLSGCSVNRALSQPPKKDLSFIKAGQSRDNVRSELGNHAVSVDDASCDIFSFPEGSGGGKYARAFIYSLLDVASLGLTEIFTNPIETALNQSKIRMRTCFDNSNKLKSADKVTSQGNTSINIH